MVTPAAWHEVVANLQKRRQLSQRRAWPLAQALRTTVRYRLRRPAQEVCWSTSSSACALHVAISRSKSKSNCGHGISAPLMSLHQSETGCSISDAARAAQHVAISASKKRSKVDGTIALGGDIQQTNREGAQTRRG